MNNAEFILGYVFNDYMKKYRKLEKMDNFLLSFDEVIAYFNGETFEIYAGNDLSRPQKRHRNILIAILAKYKITPIFKERL